jgi:hypothetical protein
MPPKKKKAKDHGVAGPFPLPEGDYFLHPVVTRRAHWGDDPADRGAIAAIQQEVGVPVTGHFDEATAEAVRAWRDREGLGDAKFVDREVWDKMAGS